MVVGKENTCIVIVTYNPDDSFLESVRFYKQLVDHIVIVDNGSDKESFLFSSFAEDDNSELISSENNNGIGWALNAGIKKALNYNPDWIITFDQDSLPMPEILDYYNQVIQEQPMQDKIGLISGKFAENPLAVTGGVTWKHSSTLITSGTLHNVKVFEDIGWYNEEMFIDGVDFEFTLRVQKKGYYTILILNEILKHRLGTPKIKKILGCTIESSNHNPLRRYYMARNHVYISRRFFFSFPYWILKKNYFFGIAIVKILLVDDQSGEKLKQIWNGIKDGLRFR